MNAYPTLREALSEAPFGLAMSSGFFGFFAHTGMLIALLEAGHTPVQVTGTSAGALVGGMWAAGADPLGLKQRLLGLTREDFWDPAPGPGVLRGQKFRALLEALLPTQRFEQTRVPFATSVFEPLTGRTVVLRDGKLAPAIHASCAVPLMFHPVRIGGRYYVDGGVSDRAGLVGMPQGARVFYHHLTSRSPWRRRQSPALKIPTRPNLFALAIHDLPRAHPFDLASGRRALDIAYARTKQALSRRLEQNAVHI